MTIDEAISHALEVAERYERMEDSHDDKLKEECLQCAADHRQLAEWLTELKELEAKHWDECRQIAHYDDELKEAKRLLKSAANVLNMFLPCDEDYNCSECIKQRQNCAYDDSFKWRYADEARALIGEENDHE